MRRNIYPVAPGNKSSWSMYKVGVSIIILFTIGTVRTMYVFSPDHKWTSLFAYLIP